MTIYFMIFYGLLSSFYFYPRKENWSQKQTLNYDSTRKYDRPYQNLHFLSYAVSEIYLFSVNGTNPNGKNRYFTEFLFVSYSLCPGSQLSIGPHLVT